MPKLPMKPQEPHSRTRTRNSLVPQGANALNQDYSGLMNMLMAPARGMQAMPPETQETGSTLGDWLMSAHETLDPVRAMGGYGNLAAMALPPGAPKARMPYGVAKTVQAQLEQAVKETGAKMRAYPKTSMGPVGGLTPDHIKQTPQWKADKAAVDKAMSDLRNFNSQFLKEYRAEIAADRKARGR